MSNTNINSPDDDFLDLLSDFLDESSQLLDRLNENLLKLDDMVQALDDGFEGSHDMDFINEMFRSAHSLKGLSAMLGLKDINLLTHKIENVFDAARNNKLRIRKETVDVMFSARDHLVQMVDALRNPNSEAIEYEVVLMEITSILRNNGAEKHMTSQKDAELALSRQAGASQALQTPDSSISAEAREGESRDDSRSPVSTSPSPSPGDAKKKKKKPSSASSHQQAKEELIQLFAEVVDEKDVPGKYMSIFIDETEIALDSVTETLLSIEGTPDRAASDLLLMTSHRIKGSAASIGLNRVAKLAHLMEDVLQQMRETGTNLSPDQIDVFLKCSDAIRNYTQGLRKGSPESGSFPHLSHELLTVTQPASEEEESECEESEASDVAAVKSSDWPAMEARMKEFNGEGRPCYLGQVWFTPGLPLVGLKARLIFEKLSQLGRVLFCEPHADALEDLEELDCLGFGLASEISPEEMEKHVRVAGVARFKVRARQIITGKVSISDGANTLDNSPNASKAPCVDTAKALTGSSSMNAAAKVGGVSARIQADNASANSGGGNARGAQESDGKKATETLRVDIERLDQLMNLAGQLVINKARFSQIGEGLKHVLIGKQASQRATNLSALLQKLANSTAEASRGGNVSSDLDLIVGQTKRIQGELDSLNRELAQIMQAKGDITDLFEAVHQLELISDGIQKSVMDTRMVPIGPLFQRFRRVIRDISRANGKEIQLVIRGEKTELDKRMIDELSDPIIHMVRNSADHGIESREERRAAGKPAHGTVSLDAYHRGNSIVIQVHDDGRGLNPERIKKKAVEKGIVSELDIERMTAQQLFQLIWEPGFSTAEKVTEISGRGMGMDIVKSKIEQINGTVELESELGKGTTITIKLPLTLAILPCLMSEIDGEVFAFSIESVVEIVNVSPRDLSRVHGMRTARVRGRVISVVDLNELFTWNRLSKKEKKPHVNDRLTLVIIGNDGQEVGLVVDHLLGEEDIVIKSLAENFQNIHGIAGASILGDGRVSLILDIAAMIDMAFRSHLTAHPTQLESAS